MDERTKQVLALGREHYEKREFDKAEHFLRECLARDVRFADILNMLGVIAHDRGQLEEAQHHFEEALRVNPNYTEAALNLSVVYNELGRYDEGRRLYEQAHNSRGGGGLDQLEPLARGKIANMHRDLGDAYTAVGLLDHAIVEFQKALRVCPTFVDIRTKLANTLRDLGRYDAAIDEFQAICDLAPDYLPARTHYGVTLWRIGRVEQARTQWKAVLERDPSNRSCQVYLSMTSPDGAPRP